MRRTKVRHGLLPVAVSDYLYHPRLAFARYGDDGARTFLPHTNQTPHDINLL